MDNISINKNKDENVKIVNETAVKKSKFSRFPTKRSPSRELLSQANAGAPVNCLQASSIYRYMSFSFKYS